MTTSTKTSRSRNPQIDSMPPRRAACRSQRGGLRLLDHEVRATAGRNGEVVWMTVPRD